MRVGAWLRTFVFLLIATLVPILLLLGALILSDSVLRDLEAVWVAAIVVGAAVAWSAVLAVVFARTSSDDLRAMLTVARRGEHDLPQRDAAHVELARALDERNRQLVTLAHETSAIPIEDAPQGVVRAVVMAARSVMGDPTWRCAILSSRDPAQLPTGVYGSSDDDDITTEITDLERWAAVAGGRGGAVRAEGPWGAFAVVDLAAGQHVRAVLYAPWEGRAEPTHAEIALLALVGQHAGTAIEHSLLYARLSAQTSKLDRLTAVQADFLRGVTHDLQTPLTSIGALSTELRANRDLPQTARADLDMITHQAERLRRMVGQLLVASRLEAGVVTPSTEVFAPGPIIERTWLALRADRTFSLEIEGTPHLVVGDPDRFEQVLWAVLDNAVKYSAAGSPVGVTVRPEPGCVAITVQDAGTGMDDETRRHAFDQFFRSTHARRLAPDGSGVGLYAARGLTELMGGTIEIDSVLGSGSALTVRLPAEPSDAE